ncbi:uncharacterized protein LOC106163040 [Lingula anatina]|uniref:Uncharacterized protein LOC106163040 n=1 Tax=Lingula anatina TaxID=7574 RepID=A0A1S3ICH8_LINAN|nr:uncharacterized protein LOC106163040 [Lingula anatina]|eukprot:XP_013395965.1 uncharacterized protein LOC106163040 [Lingula anatina]
MAEGLRKPTPLSFEGNVEQNWKTFVREYDIYVGACYSEKTPKQKAYMLLNLAGSDAIEKFESFTFNDDEDKEDPDILKAKFSEICNPRTNVILERYRFNLRAQQDGERFQSFLADLKHKIKSCNYGNLEEDMLRDRIVIGIKHENTRKVLLRENNLTLTKAVHICQIHECSEVDAKQMQQQNPVTVHLVNKKKAQKPRQTFSHGRSQASETAKCRNCSSSHAKGKCPAYGKSCHKCGKLNHFQVACRSQSQKSKSPRTHKVIREVNTDSCSDTEADLLVIDSVHSPHAAKKDLHVKFLVHDVSTEVKVDTGAKCNVMSLATFDMLRGRESINTADKMKLIGFTGDAITPVGSAILPCELRGETHDIKFNVIDANVQTLLGLPDCMKLKLLQLGESVYSVNTTPDMFAEFPDIFDQRLGQLPVKYKITVDSQVTPVVRPVRKLPVAVKDKVKQELRRMESQGIIAKVTKPTDWVSAMVVTTKKNTDTIRICIDPGDLNKAIKRPRYPMRTVDEIISDMPNAHYFTVLDAKQAFLLHSIRRRIFLPDHIWYTIRSLQIPTTANGNQLSIRSIPASHRKLDERAAM